MHCVFDKRHEIPCKGWSFQVSMECQLQLTHTNGVEVLPETHLLASLQVSETVRWLSVVPFPSVKSTQTLSCVCIEHVTNVSPLSYTSIYTSCSPCMFS